VHLQGGGACLPFLSMPALTDLNLAAALRAKPKEYPSGRAPSHCNASLFLKVTTIRTFMGITQKDFILMGLKV